MVRRKYSRQDFDFWVTIATRWRDMDALRHVNHAVYLTYMESARVDYYQYLGFMGERWDIDISTILVSMKVDYHQQVTHPARLDIGHRISRVGTKSFDIFNGIFLQGEQEPVLTATFTIVPYNYKTQSTLQVPEVVKHHLRPFSDSS